MKNIFMPGKVRYTVLIALVTVAFVISCITYMFVFRLILQEDNKVYFNEVAAEAARSYENEFKALLDSAINLSNFIPWMNSYPESERADQLASLLKTTVSFYDLVYIDLDGNALSPRFGSAIISGDYFTLASRGVPNISSAVLSEFTNELINIFAVPAFSGSDNITGVLACIIETERLNEMMSNDTFAGNASNYIMNADGVIILAPSDGLLDINAGLPLFNAVHLTSGDTADIKARDATGSFSFSFNGESYYASYKSIGISDWMVLTVVRNSDVNAVTQNVFKLVIIFTTIFTIVFAIFIVIYGVTSWILNQRHEETQKERDYLKFVDALTGGPSFEKFTIDAEEAFAGAADGEEFAMLSMDISKFRTVNDHLGHDEGSRVLKKLADIVQRNIFEGEAYTRVSADHFYLLVKYNAEEQIFDRINIIINDAEYDIQEFKLILLFGIYKIDDVHMDLRSIIDRADLARKTIKNHNESTISFFDNEMLSKIREEKKIENVMENALECNEFKVYLQPKYDLQNRAQIIGAEALVRWFRDGKMIPPGGFIPIFEKNGFILKIDRFVFEEVCKQQRTWLSRGYEMKTISVNMSRMNLQKPSFVHDLYEICAKYEVPTKYFEIEITESVAFENLDVLTRVFRELKNYGFHISIDDFGTGYSSLNMLKNLPVDILKIDRTFLTETYDKRANDILSHVISLALALHMRTICEGIETKDQADLLKGFGCDMAQGFYFARPMPIEEYEKLVYSNVMAK